MSKRYRHIATGVILPLFFAAGGFFDLTQRPGFAAFRRVDILQLLVVGTCFGIALTGFIEFLRQSPSR